ncbi:hypothetical protein Ciccas_000938 [Cichlidogyrus casuarinus]|uniref:SANT domain-containing protein n=1 Tax=Cichlidogyrus casuarinus TaxID=1844966 RepID=A0ABD2QLG9_9PLAT
MTMELRSSVAEQENQTFQKTKGKWTHKEVQDLKNAVERFGNDLAQIAEAIETKSEQQIKEKIYEQEMNQLNDPSSKAIQSGQGGRRKQAFISDQQKPEETSVQRENYEAVPAFEHPAEGDIDEDDDVMDDYVPSHGGEDSEEDYFLEA